MSDEGHKQQPRLGLAGKFTDDPRGGFDRAELWPRVWLTLGALIVYRLGSYLPTPGLDLIAVRNFSRLDFFEGGLIPNLSIFSLGILPYVSAFVIVQLLARILPRPRRMATDDAAWRDRVNGYVPILTVTIAAMQGVGIATALGNHPGFVVVPGILFKAMTALTLAAGATFLMWLADQITARGIGDGVLVVFACSTLSDLPFAIFRIIEMVRVGDVESYWLLIAFLATVAMIALVVVVERALRWIPIHDPGSEIGNRIFFNLALRLNPAGILAPLAAFVLATLLWQGMIVAGSESPLVRHLVATGIGYVLVDGLLVVLFAFFYGLALFDPRQTAQKLHDTGGSITGFPPGEASARYLRRVQTLLAAIGAVYLVVACVLPELVRRRFYLPLPFSGFEFFLLAWLMVRIHEGVPRIQS